MDDLSAFLAARYGEAEAAATPGRDALDDLRFELKRGDPYEQHLSSRIEDGLDSQTRVWRELVLRDIALKRAILAEHQHVMADAVTSRGPESFGCRTCDCIPDEGTYGGGWCATVRQLGTEFSDHPGYKPGWAPEGEPDGT